MNAGTNSFAISARNGLSYAVGWGVTLPYERLLHEPESTTEPIESPPVFASCPVAGAWGEHGLAVAGVSAGVGRRGGASGSKWDPGSHRASGPLGLHLRRQWFPQKGVAGEGRRARHGAGSGARAAGRVQGEASLHPGPLPRGGAQGEHPQLPDGQPALGGAAGGRRRRSFRDQRGPGSGAALRSPDEGTESRTRVRALDRGRAQRLFDALQLPHLVELSDNADSPGALSGAGLRSPLQRRQPGEREKCSRPGAEPGEESEPARQHSRPA